MKRVLSVIALAGSMVTLLAGCADLQPTVDQTQSAQQETLLQEGNRQTGMPNIVNFTERKELKVIQEERDKANLITYMYTENEMDGKWVYQGEAIGFPIPYSTEYTNPDRTVEGSTTGEFTAIPQADPNGLFNSQSTQADWIMAVNPTTNQPEVEYMEPNVVVRVSKIPAYLCEPWSLPKGY